MLVKSSASRRLRISDRLRRGSPASDSVSCKVGSRGGPFFGFGGLGLRGMVYNLGARCRYPPETPLPAWLLQNMSSV